MKSDDWKMGYAAGLHEAHEIAAAEHARLYGDPVRWWWPFAVGDTPSDSIRRICDSIFEKATAAYSSVNGSRPSP